MLKMYITVLLLSILVAYTQSNPCNDGYQFNPPAGVSVGPEPCDHIETGSNLNNFDRTDIVNLLNHYRSKLANGCQFLNSIPKKAKNMRKLKYNCEIEETLRFSCSDVVKIGEKQFKPDNFIWRGIGIHQTMTPIRENLKGYQQYYVSEIDQRGGYGDQEHSDGNDLTAVVFDSWATSIGCYQIMCKGKKDKNGNKERRYYMQCATGYPIKEYSFPLYEPGKPCEFNSDCTIKDFGKCDSKMGLCELSAHNEKIKL